MSTEIDRRDFLKVAGGALAAAAAGNVLADDAPKPAAKKRDIKNAIMFATVPGGDKMSVMDKFKMIRDAGFDGTEAMSGMNRDEVLKARDATGLIIPSVCNSVHWGSPISDPKPEVRAAGVAGLEVALHDAKAYGATSVLMVVAVVNQHVSYADAYQRSQEELRKVTPLAEELGVKIASENVWNHFLLSPLEAARYVDELGDKAMGWHFDVGNVIAFGWPEQWIHILGKRIQKLHIKEFSRKKQNDEGMWKGFDVEYLEGDNNWPAVVKALDDVGYHGWAIAEPAYHPPGMDDATFLKDVRTKMDTIFAM